MLRYLVLILSLSLDFRSAAQSNHEAWRFEAVSIRPAPSFTPADLANGKVHVGMRIRPPRVEIEFWNLEVLLSAAFGVQRFQVVSSTRLTDQPFNLVAVMPEGATKENVPDMLQALMVDRFGLRVHHERRKVKAYTLVAASGGPRVKASKSDQVEPTSNHVATSLGVYPTGERTTAASKTDRKTTAIVLAAPEGDMTLQESGGTTRIDAPRMTMATLAKSLSSVLEHPVIDKSGLQGIYQINIDYPTATPSSVSASLRKLGLELHAGIEGVDFIVVEQINKTPTDNELD